MPKRSTEDAKRGRATRRTRADKANGEQNSGTADVKPSTKLKELGSAALTAAFESFCQGDRLPFVVFHYRHEDHTIKIESERGVIDASLVDDLRNLLAETCPKASRYAIVFDSYLTTDSVKQDAIVMECSEKGNGGVAFLVAQRYRQVPESNDLEAIGEPDVIGTTASILQ